MFGTLTTMLIDGKQIAYTLRNQLTERVKGFTRKPTLGIIVVRETPQIRTFVTLKQRFGADIGVPVDVVRMPNMAEGNEELLRLVLRTTRDFDGLIVQLPLPSNYDLDQVIQLYPLSHDVDVIGAMAYTQFEEDILPFKPPVVAAFAEILKQQHMSLAGKRVLIVGKGRLVGAPAAIWATRLGAYVQVADSATENFVDFSREADLIILGAGSPHMLKPDMVSEGVVVFDAGTSEQEGVLVGDADPAVAEKAALFTPTPGGIGPITVAKVFENLLTLYELKNPKAQDF
jgi:methylenetetrahydrofolate dehydrogenase (NADP+) / methenyltetrahydrofolate cyclohydrolase